MISTADCICPLRSRSEMVRSGDSSEEILSFEVSGFAGWSAEWIQDSVQLEQVALPRATTFWLQGRLAAYLANVPQGVAHSLLCLRHPQQATVWLSVQTFNFQAGRQIRQAATVEKEGRFRRWLSGWLSFKVLVLGQFMVSGPYGSLGLDLLAGENTKTTTTATTSAALLHAVAQQLMQRGKTTYWGILVKDLVPAGHPLAAAWESMGYYPLPVDPSMQLSLPNRWRDFTDYLLDLSSKYRVRYRRARKQLGAIEKRVLNVAEARHFQAQMHELYHAVKAEADFDAINLSEDYFTQLKEKFPADCSLVGYFLAEKLVGFTSSIANGDTLHAHYLGFEAAINSEHHLYHNMLFDLVEQGIRERFKTLDFGRTALAIKSSMGASPRAYCCSLYGMSKLTRLAIRYFTPVLFKSTVWEERNPFKAIAD